MNSLLFVLCFIFLALHSSESQQAECQCPDLCTATQATEYILRGSVKKISKENDLIHYRILVKSNLKGKTDKVISVSADTKDPCILTLEKKEQYLLFLEQRDNQFWLSACHSDEWSSKYADRVKKCFDCPLLKCKDCPQGNIIDENGCRTCACSGCPDGTSPVLCFVEPCSFKETQCPEAEVCYDDYCGGCKAHFFDAEGNEICKKKSCDPVLCDMKCDHGFKVDENGCEYCECNECPPGVPFVDCFAQPCSFQETECPEAAVCYDDYCGGCKAHYFDAAGNEICRKSCEPETCKMKCEYGFKVDENGCEYCECNECPPGVPFVDCFAQPCSFQETECPEAAVCYDDYCGGCKAHYFDAKGNEICQKKSCEPETCKMKCEYGFKVDENGCEYCECNECPPGVPFVDCFAQPCSFQETECPEAAVCYDDYCGGCKAHYFDAAGTEICKKQECPEVMCTLFCENGYKKDKNGCDLCKCKGSPK